MSSAKAEIYAILKRLAGEGLAVLMISSELPELVLHANRVVMMAHGQVSRDTPGACDFPMPMPTAESNMRSMRSKPA